MTSLPSVQKGKEELMLNLLMKGKLNRVSVSLMNYNRLKSFMNCTPLINKNIPRAIRIKSIG